MQFIHHVIKIGRITCSRKIYTSWLARSMNAGTCPKLAKKTFAQIFKNSFLMVFWFPSAAVYRCSTERYFEKFHKIHSKTPTIELQVMSMALQNKRRHCRCFPIWMVISTSQRSLRFWNQHFVKNGLIRNFSGLHFPLFGLNISVFSRNTGKYR